MENNVLSLLGKHALAIDHLAIAVTNLEQSIAFYRDMLGFEVTERRLVEGEFSGMDSATIKAGNVTFVLVEATNESSNVAQYINHYGPGVQHVAIEVSDIHAVVLDLEKRGFKLITDILQTSELDQTFSSRDPVSGMMFEIIQRNNNKVGFDDNNVKKLFRAMESQKVY